MPAVPACPDRRCAIVRRRPGTDRAAAGFSLPEVLLVISIVSLLLVATIPILLSSADRSRGLAAVRYLGARMSLARAQAVSRSANVALRFEQDARGIRFAVFADGNGNGVRTAEILAGIDPVLDAPVYLSDLFTGVAIALGPAAGGSDPLQIGSTNLLSFTPAGTATSGTVYVRSRDGTQWAVRVLGATARTRVLRYAAATGEWVHAF
jgi:prepilin-type N-terminal cleavage/methylation domain-containing protein